MDTKLIRDENKAEKKAIDNEQLLQDGESKSGRIILENISSLSKRQEKDIDMNFLVFDRLFTTILERSKYQNQLDPHQEEEINDIDDNLEMLLRGMITIRDKNPDRNKVYKQGVKEIKQHLRVKRFHRSFAKGREQVTNFLRGKDRGREGR